MASEMREGDSQGMSDHDIVKLATALGASAWVQRSKRTQLGLAIGVGIKTLEFADALDSNFAYELVDYLKGTCNYKGLVLICDVIGQELGDSLKRPVQAIRERLFNSLSDEETKEVREKLEMLKRLGYDLLPPLESPENPVPPPAVDSSAAVTEVSSSGTSPPILEEPGQKSGTECGESQILSYDKTAPEENRKDVSFYDIMPHVPSGTHREKEQLETILSGIEDSEIRSMEKELRMNDEMWNKAGWEKPDWTASYVAVYFAKLADEAGRLYDETLAVKQSLQNANGDAMSIKSTIKELETVQTGIEKIRCCQEGVPPHPLRMTIMITLDNLANYAARTRRHINEAAITVATGREISFQQHNTLFNELANLIGNLHYLQGLFDSVICKASEGFSARTKEEDSKDKNPGHIWN